MPPLWRHQLRILAVLAVLAVPVAAADYLLLAPGRGGWISLNFRGLGIGAYGLYLVVHALVALSIALVVHRRTPPELRPLVSRWHVVRFNLIPPAAALALGLGWCLSA